MALGQPIKIRLSVEKQLMYEAEASAKNLPLATYLRERLDTGDSILEEISALRRAVERATTTTQATNTGLDMSVMLEMLLLLRQMSQPQKTQVAQQELKRIGFDIWDGQQGDK